MKIVLHRNFIKRYRKLNRPEQQQFKKRRDLFLDNPFHPLLYNHALHGEYNHHRSINITGDLRVIYQEISPDTAHFIALGTHPELYG